ncbi:hypothetical protein GCM10009562_02860 [Nocardioides aquaticus]
MALRDLDEEGQRVRPHRPERPRHVEAARARDADVGGLHRVEAGPERGAVTRVRATQRSSAIVASTATTVSAV